MENVTVNQSIQEGEPVTMTELTAFAGKGSYLKDWEKYHEKKSPFAGFNGWAAIFGVQWFFYRKLYVQGLISVCFGVCILSCFVILADWSLGAETFQQYDHAIEYCVVGIYFLCNIAIGYWANIALYKKAVRTIRSINQLNLDNERHLDVIRSLGQPSFEAVLFLYIGTVVSGNFARTVI